MSDLAGRIADRLSLPTPRRRKEIRLRAGLTRREVGYLVGVSQHAIYLYETGEITPAGDHLRRYVQLLLALEDAR
jgi:predicted transcriptional regulator